MNVNDNIGPVAQRPPNPRVLRTASTHDSPCTSIQSISKQSRQNKGATQETDTPADNGTTPRSFLKMPKRLLVALAALVLVLVLGACGDSDDTSSSDTTASTAGDGPQLTFDGSDCVYSGPEEVTAGVVTVDLVNSSDNIANLFVARIEGVTFQDIMDAFDPEPRLRQSRLPGTFDMGGVAPADPGETLQWEKDLGPGQYVLICFRNRGGGGWFGSGLTVV